MASGRGRKCVTGECNVSDSSWKMATNLVSNGCGCMTTKNTTQ